MAASASAPTAPGSRNPADKRRAANLLRDYYGLGSPSGAPGSPSTTTSKNAFDSPTQSDVDAGSSSHANEAGLNLATLLKTHSLSGLLAKESELITEIRELDGERQSLVYNHHHELVAASDSIRNMKTKSESLDGSLDALKTSFEAMSNLAADLETLHSTRSDASTKDQVDALKDLEPIVTLPTQLADLIHDRLTRASSVSRSSAVEPQDEEEQRRKTGLAQAERLWGTMEPVLAAWTDAGVVGVREIAAECRSILKEGRKAIVQATPLL
ncbi:hypothetical protein BCV70DRAFT_198116 [Testicularia cyperi]|uniref:Vacuolar protein sorting-associated protein 51 homolog n=1 Tax=Testicularia cyperi TaxID=1882483 RepID=A0A317XU56_9BASI|nr:hypothetical protein BCV70DRAFT_198116 [Testicularia cyperi]